VETTQVSQKLKWTPKIREGTWKGSGGHEKEAGVPWGTERGKTRGDVPQTATRPPPKLRGVTTTQAKGGETRVHLNSPRRLGEGTSPQSLKQPDVLYSLGGNVLWVREKTKKKKKHGVSKEGHHFHGGTRQGGGEEDQKRGPSCAGVGPRVTIPKQKRSRSKKKKRAGVAQ